jgi:putative phosphoesterase
MRIAALYDIHGNAPALRAVLSDVDAAAPDLVVVGGDVVAGPQPVEALELLLARGRPLRWVMGNGDRDLDPWVAGRLSAAHAALLASFEPVVVADGVLFCHGTPASDTARLTRVTPDERLADAVAGVPQQLVVCGHTHQQFDRRTGRHRVVNAGSVGLPFEGDAAAFWLFVDDGEPHLRRTAYDIDAALAELRATGAPGIDDLFRESLYDFADPTTVATFFEHARNDS